MRQVAHINAMNDLEPTEMNIEGTFFDPKTMLRLAAEWQRGLFFWNDDYTALLYREPQIEPWKSE